MLSKKFFMSFCAFAIIGLTSSKKIERQKFNATTIHKPFIKNTVEPAQSFWDNDFCNDWDDLDAFPNPDNCYQYLICWGGVLYEDECVFGELFDPWEGFCRDENLVTCLDAWPDYPEPDELCPPPDSTEIRFLPSEYCDEYYICLNGQPVLLYCRPGQHWNMYDDFCDDPENAGCDVRRNVFFR